MNYKLGSHNSMSYLPPKQWWMKPFHFIAKCQSKSLIEQYNSGVRVFDIRIKRNEYTHEWEFAHGAMTFKKEKGVYWYFDELNNLSEPVYVRLVLEYSKEPKDIEDIVELFQYSIKQWKRVFKNITFFEFRCKYNWKELCKSTYKPTMHQAVSSMTGSIIDDWWPWLYAKTHNKDILKQGTDKDILLMDFI